VRLGVGGGACGPSATYSGPMVLNMAITLFRILCRDSLCGEPRMQCSFPSSLPGVVKWRLKTFPVVGSGGSERHPFAACPMRPAKSGVARAPCLNMSVRIAGPLPFLTLAAKALAPSDCRSTA
jgi:hypothetical protein